VIRLERNSGKGRALTEGLKEATGDVLLFLDADLGETAKEAAHLLPPILNGEADMTIAVLPRPTQRGGMGLVLRAAHDGIKQATGRSFGAPLSGQRALTRELTNRIGCIEEKFGVEVALTIDALRCGARVLEVPVAFRHRETGRDLRGFLHRWKQYRDVKRAVRSRCKQEV
jgi:glycosyltransferase involved in cell wall biosynthesis